jgi:peptidylprolyl isomerase
MKVEAGKFVKVEYTGTFDNGEVFDSSEEHGSLLGFTVGSGDLIKGFDDAVMGMEIGQVKSFHVTPEEGYGPYQDDMIKDVPKAQFGDDSGQLKVGIQIVLQTPEGYVIPATVKAIEGDNVKLDFNHPLAGKPLNFKIKVVEILDEPPEGEGMDGCGCGCDCGDHDDCCK